VCKCLKYLEKPSCRIIICLKLQPTLMSASLGQMSQGQAHAPGKLNKLMQITYASVKQATLILEMNIFNLSIC